MPQQSLFPVRVRQLIPNMTGTADLSYFAVGDDGHEYAVKASEAKNPSLPAAEYLCYCLASMCQIAVPQSAQLILPDQTTAFGSRFEGGVLELLSLGQSMQSVALQQCSEQLTALLTLDVFLSNDDRHGTNFLVRQSRFTKEWTMIAIDFSRALWHGGFPVRPVFDLVSSGHSSITIKVLKHQKAWSDARFSATINTLNSVPIETYKRWVDAMPDSWKTDEVKNSIAWWGSSERPSRISDALGCLS